MKDYNSVYAWLESEISKNKIILTASKRLARDLKNQYIKLQLKKNKNAWDSPKIYFWREWLRLIVSNNSEYHNGVLLDKNTSLAVWQRCLKQTVDDPLINLQNLALNFSETLRQISDWCIPLSEISTSSNTPEEKLFTETLELYVKKLNDENWVDNFLLVEHVLNDKKNKWLKLFQHYSELTDKGQREIEKPGFFNAIKKFLGMNESN